MKLSLKKNKKYIHLFLLFKNSSSFPYSQIKQRTLKVMQSMPSKLQKHPVLIIKILFKKYILLIMLLQLSYLIFSPLSSSTLYLSSQHHPPPLSSCPWVVHISSLASPFPTLFLTSSCLFCFYHLCFLFPVPFSPFLIFFKVGRQN